MATPSQVTRRDMTRRQHSRLRYSPNGNAYCSSASSAAGCCHLERLAYISTACQYLYLSSCLSNVTAIFRYPPSTIKICRHPISSTYSSSGFLLYQSAAESKLQTSKVVVPTPPAHGSNNLSFLRTSSDTVPLSRVKISGNLKNRELMRAF